MAETRPQAVKWYFKTSCVVIVFLSVGPLALPLVWMNPKYSQKTKLIATIVIIALSYLVGLLLINSLNSLKQYYEMAFQNNF